MDGHRTIRDILGKELLIFDGGMGFLLQSRGMPTGVLPERLNLSNPEMILEIHKEYLLAGAQVLTTNTFGANGLKFSQKELADIVAAAVGLARRAKAEAGCPGAFVALDISSTGKLLEPLGSLSFDECYRIFAEVARLGWENGADLAIIETMGDTYEAKAAVLAVKENTPLPVLCTMTFDAQGRLLCGGDLLAMTALLEGLGVDALGLNCGLGPEQTKLLCRELLVYASIPVMVQPNAGLPKMKDGKTYYDISPEAFAEETAQMARDGAWVVGGCCGTTPDHIRALAKRCAGMKPQPVTEKGTTLVSSYARAVQIGAGPVVIGERINPTGKKRFKQALIDHDMNYAQDEAIKQKDAGADILDVNVGLPDVDEAQTMLDVMRAVQEVVDLPLQIDSGTPAVIEGALRHYNGKALVNSVNGKQSVMAAVFPLIRKYGGVVVGLTLDEEGIPPTAEGRLAIARRIVEEAARYGIHKKNILIDPLTLTVSAQQTESAETLRALTLIKRELGVGTVLVVSNISFGLPRRELVNTVFFGNALYAGLDACIINPVPAMMDVLYASRALSGVDANCAAYVERFSQPAEAAPRPINGAAEKPLEKSSEKSLEKPSEKSLDILLQDYVFKGQKEPAYTAAQSILADRDSLFVIDQCLVPALDRAGRDYETGRIFLPQLIMCAEAAKRAFDAIKEKLAASGAAETKKGKIVLATVEGDIHDIGKNIVKALLENYGYDVIDLGKSVPAQLVLDTVAQENVRLVGLSALMTTTVVSMEKTIALLKRERPDCLVMVGGAVLNEEYAQKINADFYGKDAMASVAYAKKVFGEKEARV